MHQQKYVVVGVILGLLGPVDWAGSRQRPSSVPTVKRFEKTIPVGPEALLMIENSSLQGDVLLQTWERPEVRIHADIHSTTTEVETTTAEMVITVKLARKPSASTDLVHFTAWIPNKCEVELSAINGNVTVRGARSRLKVRTVDGNISLIDVTGKHVVARSSTNGKITLSGGLQDGKYSFFSLSGTIDVTFSDPASFFLDAAAHEGKIEIEGFQLKNEKQTAHHREGVYGSGQATLNVATDRGHIRLRKQ
jgi:DUF4097 and DUF4098 domain-containing protein YvlB